MASNEQNNQPKKDSSTENTPSDTQPTTSGMWIALVLFAVVALIIAVEMLQSK